MKSNLQSKPIYKIILRCWRKELEPKRWPWLGRPYEERVWVSDNLVQYKKHEHHIRRDYHHTILKETPSSIDSVFRIYREHRTGYGKSYVKLQYERL